MTPTPLAVAHQIERMPGVAQVGYQNFIPAGYITDPKNRVFVQMYGDNARKVFTERPITPAQWDMLHNQRDGVLVSRWQADKWHLKPGDTLTIIAPQVKKADGSTTWTFKVLSIVGDMAYMTNGYILGNYDYFDKARPLASQGQVMNLQVQTSDASRTADIAQQIDNTFANSPNSTQSITERAALDISTSGVDIATVDRGDRAGRHVHDPVSDRQCHCPVGARAPGGIRHPEDHRLFGFLGPDTGGLGSRHPLRGGRRPGRRCGGRTGQSHTAPVSAHRASVFPCRP